MMQKKEELAPPPSVWQTIAAGFDLTTRRLWLLILPVLLDAFLWLGPRLSMRQIIEQTAGMLPPEAGMQELTSQMLAVAGQTNLFTSLSVPFIGVPVLMVGITPEATPLPTTITELQDPLGWLGLFLLLSVIGVGITAVYYTLIAHAITQQDPEADHSPAAALPGRVLSLWLKLIGLGLILVVTGVILYIPLLPIAFVAALFSQLLASLVLMLGPLIMLWVIIYTWFTPQAISLYGLPLNRAIYSSIQILRTDFIPALLLLGFILIVRNVLNTLLFMADDGSWLTGVGLLGHAFIMTALIVATFIFFRDRYVLFNRQQATIQSEK
jgi:hypothetical protein